MNTVRQMLNAVLGIQPTPSHTKEPPESLEDRFFIPTRENLLVEDEDYKRENGKDRDFRKLYTLKLLQHFDNRCAMCGSQDNSVHLDHYFIPKSHGGNFLLKCADGRQLLNCVPLCQSCNCSKSDKLIEPDEKILEKIKTFRL